MVELQELVHSTDALLNVGAFQDYCPNGLQVEGRSEIRRLVSGVTACAELLDRAVALNADAVLVHHGYFWKGEGAAITGIKRGRIKRLLDADISLLAYHLPLDAHSELGNNVQLARQLGLDVQGSFGGGGGPDLALMGGVEQPLSAEALAVQIKERLGRAPLHVGNGPALIRSIGWCSGAAQSYIEQAAELGLDAFISGEISESTVHFAREAGIHYFSAGHHATEKYGVQALGERLAQTYAIEHTFIDIANPV
ncbi:Nif3-like dinuclear metal center hexameric protein [Solemya pervernicosa gill symbiont]|uniref:GTP cyclohydrolase 1 type 2 homolog n=2 Tax=Gammaproteobacteria incertae sedis TaxID=118884 RepID=A0A1T2L9T2_9GAMM|nr:Nif3-like dinuclear metal center hexameric protein [Candidatus Reidiella endopervernicosa]OOZ41867.1 Nif3-like dinuclear metal center hexameric protein [Solemya pervernicosa gill symbiont]QKQ26178.1 Nif3-like dinuclear metal center hexameric protein [Candidatus Reidiella endopervernicosa]